MCIARDHCLEVTDRSARPGVVIVEGVSDRAALEALATRRGLRLDDRGMQVVPVGGFGNLGRHLQLLAPKRSALRVAGLCDEAEELHLKRGLARAGFGSPLTRVDMERLGFFVCVADLEDELIRALGPIQVEEVVAAQGELGSFRGFQNQPAQRGRAVERQLRRFMGTRAGRKAKYARLLVEALDLTRVPRPLERVLAYAYGDETGP
jgi:hypothetical protein